MCDGIRWCERPISGLAMAEAGKLEIADIAAGYGKGIVLDGLSLTIAPGEALALLGRNGAGKTTLLRCIMGLVRVSRGEITLSGRRIDRLEPFERSRLGLGYVPQGREIFGELTVEENLLLGNLASASADDGFAFFPELAERAGSLAGGLSGGQQQKLAIARALMPRPAFLLLDEPSEGIQPSTVEDIGRTLVRLSAERGMGIVLVEQNTALALAVASRVAFIAHGRVAACETSAALRADPALIERHLLM
jgi:ABC-type branched-subunit amino acid transport system ATPase component